MTSYLRLLVLVSLLTLGVGGSASAQKAWISGMVEEPKEDSVYLRIYSDDIAREDLIKAIPLDSKHTFCIQFDVSGLLSAWLRHNGDEIRLVFEAGDSVFVSFNGAFPSGSARFYGPGQLKFQYFSEQSRLFDPWNDRVLAYHMSESSSEKFRKMMDDVVQRKWLYYHTFMEQNQDRLTDRFKLYCAHDIDYWWSSQLLKYREIRALAIGSSKPISLPYEYYDFLDTIRINNSAALNNPYYWLFIDYYAKYCREAGPDRFRTKQLEASSPLSTLNMYTYPGDALPQVMLDRPKPLQYTGKHVEKDFLIWYQVRTDEGQTSWVNAESVWISEPPLNKQDPNRTVTEVEVTKLQKTAYVAWDSLRVLSEPNNGQHLGTIRKGEEAEYLNQKTQDLYPLVIGRDTLHDNYLRVVTLNWGPGWVPASGVIVQDKYVTSIEKREIADPYTVSPMGDLDRYFYGQTLHYMAARDFFYKCPSMPYEVARQRMELYRSFTEFSEYADFVQEIIESPTTTAAQGDYTRVVAPIKNHWQVISLDADRFVAMLAEKRRVDEDARKKLMANSARGDEIDYSAVEAMAALVLKPGYEAPDFSITDINGNPVTLSSLRGKIVVVDFWASWCGPCLVQMASHQRWLNSLPTSDVVQVYVSLDHKEQNWRNYVNGQELHGIHVFDSTRSISGMYKVQALPMYYVLDRHGRIYSHSFSETRSSLFDQINRMIIEKR